MNDPGSILISCTGWREILSTINKVIVNLPPEMRKHFNDVVDAYLAEGSFEGAYERLNGRTVSQILAEYQPPTDLKALAAGEVDGVRYTLYDAPPPRPTEDKRAPDGGRKDG